MKKQILIIGEDSLLKLKLISILSRTREIRNVHILEEALEYLDRSEIGYVILTNQLVWDSRLAAIRQSCIKLICFTSYSMFDVQTKVKCDDDLSLQIIYDQLYGFSGYSDSASIAIQSSYADRVVVYPTFVDDIAFWLSEHLDACGTYYLRGPESVYQEDFMKLVSRLKPICMTFSAKERNNDFIPQHQIHTVLLRHTLEAGLEIIRHQCTCAVNLIYKLPLYAPISGITVADFRRNLGALAANCMTQGEWKRFDFISPIPNSGISYAEGLSQATGIRCTTVVEKQTNIRSFHIEDGEQRQDIIRSVMKIHEKPLRGARICIVDEAIFTGVTLKVLCRMFRECGVSEICAVIPTPPCTTRCGYCSIPTRPMILETVPQDQLALELSVDRVVFQKKAVFESVLQKTGMTCCECFL